MLTTKSLSALVCLLLAAGPASVFSVPFAKDQSLVQRQVNWDAESGDKSSIGMPDGPRLSSGEKSSYEHHEGDESGSYDSWDDSKDSEDHYIGIPGGPGLYSGNFHHVHYETHSKPPSHPTATVPVVTTSKPTIVISVPKVTSSAPTTTTYLHVPPTSTYIPITTAISIPTRPVVTMTTTVVYQPPEGEVGECPAPEGAPAPEREAEPVPEPAYTCLCGA
ncbi:hypothetical protein HFD88_007312 [Aspergillus terreus]|nr:hypothetical protein HFD88_007312 [Aspergillus terreus]